MTKPIWPEEVRSRLDGTKYSESIDQIVARVNDVLCDEISLARFSIGKAVCVGKWGESLWAWRSFHTIIIDQFRSAGWAIEIDSNTENDNPIYWFRCPLLSVK